MLIRRVIVSALVLLSVMTAVGCAAILEGEERTESLHISKPYVTPPEEQIEVSSYEELMSEILSLIANYDSSGKMLASNYNGDIEEDVNRACEEALGDNLIAAYAVAEIKGETTRIVSLYEINISISYKRTRLQMDSIVNVSTLRYMEPELLRIMSDYREEAVFLTSLSITEEDITGVIKEIYYQNPRSIVSLPITAVETFSVGGEDRIFELTLEYISSANIVTKQGETLSEYIRRNAQVVYGETDAEILLSLVNNLVASTSFDEGKAQTISVHGAPNIAATAYGALVESNAVGEGFAMAFKALCDELRFDCRVVLGNYNGMVHAWNIVSLLGDNYHIDVAMCAVNGINTAFLKTDADFIESYTWDFENTRRCNGILTYEDIVGPENPEEDPDGENGEDSEDPDGESTENGEPGELGGENDPSGTGTTDAIQNETEEPSAGSDGESSEP